MTALFSPSSDLDCRDRCTNANPTARSQAVDLDEVSARLAKLSKDQAQQTASFEPWELPTPDESESPTKEQRSWLRIERRSYDELIKDGGRPFYNIELLDDVGSNPQRHRELLSPWWPENSDFFLVFSPQWIKWRTFRLWQKSSRQIFESRLSEFIDVCARCLEKNFYFGPLELEQDSHRQSKLTTWLEYLCYECREYEPLERVYKKHEKTYKEALQSIIDLGLESHDVEKVIWGESGFEHRCRDRRSFAEHARRMRRREKHLHLKIEASRRPRPGLGDQLKQARARLKKDEKALKQLRKQDDLIEKIKHRFSSYYLGIVQPARQKESYIAWVRDQIPLIHHEMGRMEQALTGRNVSGDEMVTGEGQTVTRSENGGPTCKEAYVLRDPSSSRDDLMPARDESTGTLCRLDESAGAEPPARGSLQDERQFLLVIRGTEPQTIQEP